MIMASYNYLTTIWTIRKRKQVLQLVVHAQPWFTKSSFKGFTKAPYDYATPVQRQPEKEGDASLIWVESISTFGFKLCLRELKNFDGAHSSIRAVSEKIYNTYLLTLYNSKNICCFGIKWQRPSQAILQSFSLCEV